MHFAGRKNGYDKIPFDDIPNIHTKVMVDAFADTSTILSCHYADFVAKIPDDLAFTDAFTDAWLFAWILLRSKI